MKIMFKQKPGDFASMEREITVDTEKNSIIVKTNVCPSGECENCKKTHNWILRYLDRERVEYSEIHCDNDTFVKIILPPIPEHFLNGYGEEEKEKKIKIFVAAFLASVWGINNPLYMD